MDLRPSHQQEVQLLRRQCLQFVDPRYMRLPSHRAIRDPEVQRNLLHVIFQGPSEGSKLPERYLQRVLKRVIDHILESCGPTCFQASDGTGCEEVDVNEDLLHLYTQGSIPSSKIQGALDQVPITYIPYFPHQDNINEISITVLENPYIISGQGTTGLRTWEAALALGEYMCMSHGTDRAVLRNVHALLELGAGTGLCAMLAAKLGVKEVHATDGDENVVSILRENIVRNKLHGQVEACTLLWGSNPDYANHVDLVIGADVTYEPGSISYLVEEISARMAANPRLRAVFSATIRNAETYECFREACGRSHLRLHETDWESPEPPVLFYFPQTPIKVVELESTHATNAS